MTQFWSDRVRYWTDPWEILNYTLYTRLEELKGRPLHRHVNFFVSIDNRSGLAPLGLWFWKHDMIPSYGIYHIVAILFNLHRTEADYLQKQITGNYYNDYTIDWIYKFMQTYIFLNVI